jgi:hypothetical protein
MRIIAPPRNAVRRPRDHDLGLALQHVGQGVERRRVLAQALAFVEGERGHRSPRRAEQLAAHHRAVLVADELSRNGHAGGHEPFPIG